MNKGSLASQKVGARNAGFTLIEIMIVVAILGLLATLVTIEAPRLLEGSKRKAAKQNILRLQNAVDMYYMEKGKYPQSLNDLAATDTKTGIKFIKKLPKDPWGNDFVYKIPGLHNEEYSITSYGADGMEGGDGKNADINSWDTDEEQNK